MEFMSLIVCTSLQTISRVNRARLRSLIRHIFRVLFYDILAQYFSFFEIHV